LAQKAREQQISTRVEEELTQLRVFADSLSKRQTALIGQTPGAVEEHKGISEPGFEPWSTFGSGKSRFAFAPTYRFLQGVMERTYGPQSSTQLADVALQRLGAIQERND
jgi:hypothetical protein